MRRRHIIDPDYRGRIALGRRQLQVLLFVDVCGDTGATSHEIIDGLDLPRATVTEMLARLRRKQMVFSQKVMDEGKRRTIYQITDDGQTVADSWQLFLRSIGPRLRRVLRLED